MNKNRIAGIIMTILGVMALLGSIANGSIKDWINANDMADVVSLVLTVGFIIGGIVLIITGKKENKGV